MTQAYTNNVGLYLLTVPPDEVANLITDFNNNMNSIDALFASHSHTRGPTTGDDVNAGHYPSEPWVDYSNHIYYVAETVAAGAAVWRQIWPPAATSMTLTNLTVTNQITLTAGVGTAPLVVTSTTRVANLAVQDALTVNGITVPGIAAKGDILSGSAANILGKTSVGSDYSYLIALSTAAYGVAWRTNNGWLPMAAITYVSTNQVSVTGDQHLIYMPGMWVQFTQSGVVYTGVIISSVYSSVTTLTLFSPTNQTIANTSYTNIQYSFVSTPVNLPAGIQDPNPNGWIPFPAMASNTSASATNSSVVTYTYTITYTGDMTQVCPIGARIWFYQGSANKYGLVVAHVAGTLTVLLAQGTTSATSAITMPYYSLAKMPAGFPADAASWTVIVNDITGWSAAPNSVTTWVNDTNCNLVLPIGAWELNYKAVIGFYNATSGAINFFVWVTVSTANTTESLPVLTNLVELVGLPAGGVMYDSVGAETNILTATQATYYLNLRCGTTGTGYDYYCNVATTTPVTQNNTGYIRAVSAYL